VTLDARTLRIVVLLSWCAFLTWLWLTGETLRYLGPRTQWLVPFGALALALAAAVYAKSTHPPVPSSRPTSREMAGLAALLIPVIAGTLLMNSQLGALAASKKLTARGIEPSALADLASRNATELSFLQVNVAGHNSKFASENAIHPGRRVRLDGFVLHGPRPPNRSFELARFYITCCVADAIPLGVTIQPADPSRPAFERDDWLSVSGELVSSHDELQLEGTRIERIQAPDDPYLSFGS
jgi:uncharacterized repeat protein (TIGR03943 family)